MKRISLILFILFSTFLLFADEVVRYVDPDSAAGGDGTTWASAYDSLFDWDAAEATNLDTANDWHHVYVRSSGGTADTTAVIVSTDWITSAADYLLIEAVSGDEATASGWDTNRYRLEVTDNVALRLRVNYARVKGLQLRHIYTSVAGGRALLIDGQGASSDVWIYNCRLRGDTNASASGQVVRVWDVDVNVKLWNNIIYDCDEDAIFIDDAASVSIYNCTVYNATQSGIEADTAATIKNCAVFNNNVDFQDDSAASTIDYCASDDNTGTNNVAESGGGAAWPDDFEGAATGDFRLKSGSNLVDAALYNPGSGLYSDDIDGTDRGASNWDVGAYEYPSVLTFTAKQDIMVGFMVFKIFAIFSMMINSILFYYIIRLNKKLGNFEKRLAFFEDSDNYVAWYELGKDL